jgi:hypothetical protein
LSQLERHLIARAKPNIITIKSSDPPPPLFSLIREPICGDVSHPMTCNENLVTALNNLANSNKESADTIAEALKEIASAIRYLGMGTNSHPGAIEKIGMSLEEGLGKVASALRSDDAV